MRISKLTIFLLSIISFLYYSCQDIYDHEKYQKPDWLEGKLYTQISLQENLSKFTECLKIVGLDTIIDVSGSFTIFSPSDEAVDAFLAKYNYSSVQDIPIDYLEEIVKYSIIQDAWSVNELKILDQDGWIDPDNKYSEPRAYKRQTLLKKPNEKYWIKPRGTEFTIVDSTESSTYRKVITRSGKYAPIFFDGYFSIYNLSGDDYAFYFDRSFEPGNIYYAGARVIESDIFAENGFIHVIDEVVEPLLNAKEILERDLPGESYKTFLGLINQFPEFKINLNKTYEQIESRQGLTFDTLYDLSYPKLPFDIHEEMTGPSYSSSKYTYLYHNGLYLPTDNAFKQFIDNVLTVNSGYPHWSSFDAVPDDIKSIIVNTHFATSPIYKTDLNMGFENAEGNIIYIDESTIIRKEYGSNCTFLGLNKTVVPREFTSVTGPVYLRPGYSTFMFAMQYARVASAITKEGENYGFFPVSDETMLLDSSLIFNWVDQKLNRYNFRAYSRESESFVSQPAGILAKRILNQVTTSLPNGSANKEFLETLGGNYVIWDNSNNTVQGGVKNTFGYLGIDSTIKIEPVLMEEPTDNGTTWAVNGWFSNTTIELFGALSKYPLFQSLLVKAGLFNKIYYEYDFLVEGDFYTIFTPSDSVLLKHGADTLKGDDLVDFLKYHFVKGIRIFTDNKIAPGAYETLRVDESSDIYNTIFSTLHIQPGPDLIEILNSSGSVYVSIPEQVNRTNIMVGTDTNPRSDDKTDYITTIVIHEIDQVLTKQ